MTSSALQSTVQITEDRRLALGMDSAQAINHQFEGLCPFLVVLNSGGHMMYEGSGGIRMCNHRFCFGFI